MRSRPVLDPARSFEETVGKLYRSSGDDLAAIVATLPMVQRARMALFCYGRAHMRDLGIAIAAQCDRDTLVEAGALVGQVLFQLARERPRDAGKPVLSRKGITLASCNRGEPRFVDADPDPEPEAEAAAEPETIFEPALERAYG